VALLLLEQPASEKPDWEDDNPMCSYSVLPDGETYPFWDPTHPLFRLGNVWDDGMDAIHRQCYDGDSEGGRIFEQIDDREVVAELGDTQSHRLYSWPEWLVTEYKYRKMGV